jgi:hypothetical protein
MNSFFDSKNLLQLILKWKIHIAIITVVAIALSILFSSPFFIKPKYKSFAIVYPSNLIPYSSETPTEQMLQLFKSEDISFTLVQKFHLARHYGIDTTDSKYFSKLKDEFDGNVSISKTEFESIIIEVYDTDPILACNMVREIINMMNIKARDLQREKTSEVVNIYKDQLDFKKHQIDSIQARMTFLRQEYNLFDYNIQVKEMTKGYVKNLSGSHGGSSEINKLMGNLGEYGGEFQFLDGYLSSLTKSYAKIKTEYDQSYSDLTKQLTYTNIVTSPYPAENKSYPVRWLIVLVSTFSCLFLAVIIISIIERTRSRKKVQATVNQ